MDFLAVDFETANHHRSSACSIGLAKVENSTIVETRHYYIKPVPNFFAPINVSIHGITAELTDDAPTFQELWEKELKDYIGASPLVAHNAPFDKSVFNALGDFYNIHFHPASFFCSCKLARHYCPELLNYRLDSVCDHLGIDLSNHHDAECDAVASAKILLTISAKVSKDSLDDLFGTITQYDKERRISDEAELFNTAKANFDVNEDEVRGKVFCFTGALTYLKRSIAAKMIESAGGIVKNSISSKVNYLVVGDLSNYGEDYSSTKLKRARELKDAGNDIEIITESQFIEFVVYEGPSLTPEMVGSDSATLLQENRCNSLYGKYIFLSEGFGREEISRLGQLGAQLGPTHYADETKLTDYYIISDAVYDDLFVRKTKSRTVLAIESAMQLQKDEQGAEKHNVKFIDEKTFREYLRRRKAFEEGTYEMIVK